MNSPNIICWGDGKGSIYTKEGKDRLWREYNIVYVGGVYAAKITPRKNAAPLVELIAEDDGALFLDNHSLHCDVGWISSIRELLNAVEIKVAELNKEKGAVK